MLFIIGPVTASVTKTKCDHAGQTTGPGSLPTAAEIALSLSYDFAAARRIVPTFLITAVLLPPSITSNVRI